jgi:hypothetical protein
MFQIYLRIQFRYDLILSALKNILIVNLSNSFSIKT